MRKNLKQMRDLNFKKIYLLASNGGIGFEYMNIYGVAVVHISEFGLAELCFACLISLSSNK